jgi:hypothetical protein
MDHGSACTYAFRPAVVTFAMTALTDRLLSRDDAGDAAARSAGQRLLFEL